jgi:hypothetical protein
MEGKIAEKMWSIMEENWSLSISRDRKWERMSEWVSEREREDWGSWVSEGVMLTGTVGLEL